MRCISFNALAIVLAASLSVAQQLDIDTQIKGSRWPAFGVDTGAANAYAVTTTAALGPSLRTGSQIQFFAAHANSGASTLAVNGGSVIAIKKQGSTALASGDISAGQLVVVAYDGTYFQMAAGGGSGGAGYTLQINATGLTAGDTVNFNDSTPAAGSNGLNVKFQKSTASTTDSVSAYVPGDGTATHFLNGSGAFGAVGFSGLSGSASCSQMPALTGDVTTSAGSCSTTNVNLPDGVTQAGKLLATNISAPSSPASGHVSFYADSTDLRFHDKNASGVIGTTVVADTGASNNFLTAISSAGAISKAQPAFSNLSGSATCSQLPALTSDVTTSAGSCSTTIANNAVTAAKSAVVLQRRACTIIIGADNATAVLSTADIAPQGRQCFIPYAATVVEIEVAADAGTPNVVVAKNHGGSLTDLLSSALATASAGGIACSNTGGTTGLDGTTGCSSTLQNTSLSAGDYIETHSASAGGTAKRMSIFVTFTVN